MEEIEKLPTEAEIEEEEIPPEILAQRATARKRVFWLLIALCVVVVGVLVWEIADLGMR